MRSSKLTRAVTAEACSGMLSALYENDVEAKIRPLKKEAPDVEVEKCRILL